LTWGGALLCRQVVSITSPMVLILCAAGIMLLLMPVVYYALLSAGDRAELLSVLRAARSPAPLSEMKGSDVRV